MKYRYEKYIVWKKNEYPAYISTALISIGFWATLTKWQFASMEAGCARTLDPSMAEKTEIFSTSFRAPEIRVVPYKLNHLGGHSSYIIYPEYKNLHQALYFRAIVLSLNINYING